MANSTLTGSLVGSAVGAITTAQIAAGSISTASGISYSAYTTPASNITLDPAGKIKATALELDGVDIGMTLAKIQERLSILVPDPKRLAKYEALRQAYEHYLTLEALCLEEENANKL